MTLLEKVEELIKQATTERSHYYTASVLLEVKSELIALYAQKTKRKK
jgi:hypothetical protein